MIQRILIPLDGSILSEQALTPGLKIAEATGATVLLVRAVRKVPTHALDPMIMSKLDEVRSIGSKVADAKSYLERIKENRLIAGVTIDTAVEVGGAATVIIDTAMLNEIDLIVMSTHGATGLNRLMYGSVTEKVLRNAPCALLAARSAEIPENMLVPIDGSPLSEAVVPIAIEVAAAFGAAVTLTRIQDPYEAPDWREVETLKTQDKALYQRLHQEYDRHTWKYLERFIAEHISRDDLEVTYDFDRGYAPERILAVARRNECDMLAMSTHGRTGLQRWRYGSVTERVLRSSTLPMLVVRPDNVLFGDVQESAVLQPEYA